MNNTTTPQLEYLTTLLYNYFGDWFLIVFIGGFIFLLALLFWRFLRSKYNI